MAIEIKYAVNMALQYNNANEFDIEDYLLADNENGKLFLTESPESRILNEAEKSALYFLVDDSLFNASAFYEMYDSSGTKIDEAILELGYNHLIHNSIPVNLNAFYVSEDVSRIDVSVVSNQDHVINGNFEQGSGNNFTDWIKTEGNGSIVQVATGGVNGTRAVQINRVTDTPSLSQLGILAINTNYVISMYARIVSGTPSVQFSSISTTFGNVPLVSNEFRWYQFSFTTGATDTAISIDGLSNNSSFIIDQVHILSDSLNYLTEIKSYKIDRKCYTDQFQINWLNKLGGRDTWMFTAKPNVETVVERNNLIELSKLRNFESPKRIYGYREHISRKIYHLAHHCTNRETAEWLKRELIDSIDVMMVINNYYYPVMVLNSSITEDASSADFKVTLDFRLAFDNNIQTR